MQDTVNLVAYAAKLSIKREYEINGEYWQKELKIFFQQIVEECTDIGILAIGHIKGFLSFNIKDYYCYFSNVGNNQGTNSIGKLDSNLIEGVLDFNVLVYGGEEKAIETIVHHCMELLEINFKCNCTITKTK